MHTQCPVSVVPMQPDASEQSPANSPFTRSAAAGSWPYHPAYCAGVNGVFLPAAFPRADVTSSQRPVNWVVAEAGSVVLWAAVDLAKTL